MSSPRNPLRDSSDKPPHFNSIAEMHDRIDWKAIYDIDLHTGYAQDPKSFCILALEEIQGILPHDQAMILFFDGNGNVSDKHLIYIKEDWVTMYLEYYANLAGGNYGHRKDMNESASPDDLKPNLVQTLEHTPAFIHGGPFANIAHGCNSVTATRMALKLSDYTVTEAGFAADLGAEKFLDIKCRLADLHPSAVVIVATVRALKYHSGVPKADLNNEDLDALEKGLPNLLQHVSNIKNVFGLPCVVAINAFPTDTKAELDMVEAKCKELGVNVALSEVWAKGGEGGKALAEEVVRLCELPNDFRQSYELDLPIMDKLDAICTKIYHADGVQLIGPAVKQCKQLTELGFDKLPICMAKTQYSFSDDAKKLGAPKDFTITVRNLKVSAGAGFIVALTGDIMTMPGLPKVPAAERIDVDENGVISGLF